MTGDTIFGIVDSPSLHTYAFSRVHGSSVFGLDLSILCFSFPFLLFAFAFGFFIGFWIDHFHGHGHSFVPSFLPLYLIFLIVFGRTVVVVFAVVHGFFLSFGSPRGSFVLVRSPLVALVSACTTCYVWIRHVSSSVIFGFGRESQRGQFLSVDPYPAFPLFFEIHPTMGSASFHRHRHRHGTCPRASRIVRPPSHANLDRFCEGWCEPNPNDGRPPPLPLPLKIDRSNTTTDPRPSMEVGKIAPPWEFLLYSAVRWEKKEPTPSPVSHREDDECQPRSGGGRRTIARKRSGRIQPDGSVPSYESTGWNGWWRRGNGCHAHRRNRRNQTEAWILRCRKKIPSLWRRWSRRKSVSRQRDICIRSKKLACFGKEVAPFPDPSVDAKATRDKSVRDR